MAKYTGGCTCGKFKSSSDNDPIDIHTCHCGVCKAVTGQDTTHVVFFNYSDLSVNDDGDLKRVPFNADNPDGPLELCIAECCGTPIMLDDKVRRIRAIVPNLMGHDTDALPATYHAFYDMSKGDPEDGRPAHEGLQPSFEWPEPQ